MEIDLTQVPTGARELNAPGILVPEVFAKQYLPKKYPVERYAAAQINQMMQGLSIFNTITPVVGIFIGMTTDNLAGVSALFIPFGLAFAGTFIYFLETADECGWDKKAMYFWLPYQGLWVGIAIGTRRDSA